VTTEVRWDGDDKSILYFTLADDWTWAQLRGQIDAAVGMAESAHGDISAILDISGGVRVPGGNLLLPENVSQIKDILDHRPVRKGPLIVVGADAQARLMYDCLRMIDKRIGWQIYFTDTADEARAYLLSARTSTKSFDSRPKSLSISTLSPSI